MDEPTLRGSCLCGGITYELSSPFVFFQYCHCSRCRKSSGSAHAANIFVKIEQFGWTKGEPLVKRYELPEAKYYCTGFCSECGSAMPWLSRNGKYVLVPAGTLDDDPGLTPERNIHWASRAPWYLEVDELPTFEKGPKEG
jgi:hypothetical protein